MAVLRVAARWCAAPGGLPRRECLDTHTLTWANGFEWVDVCGRTDWANPLTDRCRLSHDMQVSDADFRAAVAPVLTRLGVSPQLQHRMRRRFALPATAVQRGATGSAAAATEVCCVLRHVPEDLDRIERLRALRARRRAREVLEARGALRSAAATVAAARRLQDQELKSAVDDARDEESIEQLTNRITVVVLPTRLVTVHRGDGGIVAALRAVWQERFRAASPAALINALVKACARSFQRAARVEAELLDAMEARFLAQVRLRVAGSRDVAALRDLYGVSRRASVYCRVLVPMATAYAQLVAALGVPEGDTYVHHVRSHLTTAIMLCEDARDGTQGLLSLHFERAANDLEVMVQYLTVFSSVFIPLEFIAGLYGMNVEWLPWIHDESTGGFWRCCALMAAAAAATAGWFRLRNFF